MIHSGLCFVPGGAGAKLLGGGWHGLLVIGTVKATRSYRVTNMTTRVSSYGSVVAKPVGSGLSG